MEHASQKGNNLHGLGDSVSLRRFASESLAWEKCLFYKAAAQNPERTALLEQEKANAAATCHKSDVEERAYGTNHATHDLLTGISNFDSSQRIVVLHPIKLPPPPVLNLKMFVNERKQGTTQDASKVIDAAAQSPAISLAELQTEKIVVATDRKNKETLNNTEKFDHPSVSVDSGTSQMDPPLSKSKLSTDQEVLQPKISRKPATPSLRSSSYGRKQSKIPLSPANYASMHPRKDIMLTPITKNKLQSPTIPSPFTFRTEERAARRKQARVHIWFFDLGLLLKLQVLFLNSLLEDFLTEGGCEIVYTTGLYDFAYVNFVLHVTINKKPMATPSKAANGVNKTSESPSVKRRMETYVHPSAVGSKTPGQKWQIFLSWRRSELEQIRSDRAREELREREIVTPQANQNSLTPARKPPTTISQPPSVKKSSRRLWKTSDQNPADHPLNKYAALIDSE
ncbi:hypothetical protein Tco_0371334 [Tanacetum coccineum]